MAMKTKTIIDRQVKRLVEALGAIPNIHTYSSCGGHRVRKIVSQVEEGHFYVCFDVKMSRNGWKSLSVIVYAAGRRIN
jgi:tRNA(Phe) wybutosine-synthesizing methylase Tyw3